MALCEGITAINAERDAENSPTVSRVSDLYPQRLVHFAVVEFRNQFLRPHRDRMREAFGDEYEPIKDEIQDQFRNFREAYNDEEVTKDLIDNLEIEATFEEVWIKTGLSIRFPRLVEFCGGLMTIFPNTATVEADYSRMSFRLDKFTTNMTNFSVEAWLYAMQWLDVEQLWKSFDNDVAAVGEGE